MPRNFLKYCLPVALLSFFLFDAASFSQGSAEKEAREIFQRLIGVAGVSFHEDKVREVIRGLLPRKSRPRSTIWGTWWWSSVPEPRR